MKPNLDTSFFSVVCELGKTLYTPEFELADMHKSQLVEDIMTGQLEQVRAVLEFNPVEGWCSDITEDVLSAAFPDMHDSDNGPAGDSLGYRSERIDGQLAGVARRFAA
ncbi:hypothetical protein [Labrenzia sp. DG1229]|uniref:hypothetical protein n=1 Tax=Labrenzia sp. DG1229 TaxID=681847 RepID=UPI000ABF6E99|nr:hypothetical protein [Labrenzia sp. DG1229]